MSNSRTEKIVFGAAAAAVLLFMYVPLMLIVLYSFNKTNINSWPFPGFSTKWFDKLSNDPEPRDAVLLSIRIGLISTAVAMVLGTMMAFAFARHRFRGGQAVNFGVTLPIILPGVITGVAMASFFVAAKAQFGATTIIIGHITFCIVLVFNNVLARLRRLSQSLEEASRDLGANGLRTFWHVTLPSIRTALVAAALLSFALSFDEIAVTFFLTGADSTTLPIWILGAFRNAQSLPEVNAAATVILVISLPMIAVAAYLMREEGGSTRVGGDAR